MQLLHWRFGGQWNVFDDFPLGVILVFFWLLLGLSHQILFELLKIIELHRILADDLLKLKLSLGLFFPHLLSNTKFGQRNLDVKLTHLKGRIGIQVFIIP